MNSILIINLLILLMLSGISIAGFLFIRRITNEITEYISPPAPGQESPLSSSLSAFAAILARQMAVEVKTTMAGILSGQSRSQSAVDNAETALDIAIENPAMAGMLEMLPKNIKKMAYKNPAIAKMVAAKLGSMLEGSATSGGGPSGGSVSGIAISSGNGKAKFNL